MPLSSRPGNLVAMRYHATAFALLTSSLLAACGGGGTTSSAHPFMPAAPVLSTAAPSAPVSSAAVLQTASINGAATFITAAQLPVYTFAGDTVPNQSACTGSCLAIWPAVAPPSGTLPAPWTSFTRVDNGQKQLAYNGMPLYTFASDTALTATGDGFQNFHLAHPAATPAAPTAAPATPPPSSPY
jgi:predicted lipoprotein with Yx(FWY)xxD motif